jgi:UDP-GlcNAc3NAcA epimerase
VQKEAYFYQIPCITLRNETEWVETVENKANILAGTDPEAIINAVSESVKSKKVEFIKGIYGNGDTSKLIIEELIIFPK